ncbi:hypothetical protein C8J57DRAFT_1320477 [Mycena rebaudengoi]|nr:hypothetical protein C8J57DRAFT_1320477 [Mycena rebaudengoi]
MSSADAHKQPTKPKPQLRGNLVELRGKPIGTSGAIGIAVFALGRLSDAPLQYLMFSKGWAVKAMTAVGLHASHLTVALGPGIGDIGPIPTLLTSMYAVAALRQAYWGLFTLDYSWPVGTALMVVTYNIVVDTFNTFTAVHSLGPTGSAPLALLHSFPSSFGWQQWAGIAVFVAGLAIETVAEHTRKQFKKNPKNKGKIDDTGLWSVVRHPNYLGYTLWRVGITLAAGSVGAAVGFALFQIAQFVGSGIPGVATYMEAKYGQQWVEYTKRVPSAIIPGIL